MERMPESERFGESSWASSAGVRRSMQSNRGRDTALEVRVRSALHRAGLRYRLHVRPVPGLRCTVDVVFPRDRLALFIDGCYWHVCPEHASYPVTNRDWWRTKLEATRERDQRNTEALEAAGWIVLRVWEHEDVGDVVRKKRSLKRIRTANDWSNGRDVRSLLSARSTWTREHPGLSRRIHSFSPR